MNHLLRSSIATALLVLGASSFANEAAIRKTLAERVPQVKSVEEVNKTAIQGVFEVRVNGSDIVYTDAQANYIFQGSLIDTKTMRSLTEDRHNQLSSIKFDTLPFKDAIKIVRGNGKRQLAVFADPNCGYCKKFERDLLKINDVTVHLFVYPVLGADSTEKAKAILCSKNPATTWLDWMVRDQPLPQTPAKCETEGLTRTVDFGRARRIQGTPTMFFQDDTRVPGAIDQAQIEKHLAGTPKEKS